MTRWRRRIACSPLWRIPVSAFRNGLKRGNVPKELEPLGITDFREVHYKPYRVIYRIIDRQVIFYCVLDDRRSMQSLLQRRLICG